MHRSKTSPFGSYEDSYAGLGSLRGSLLSDGSFLATDDIEIDQSMELASAKGKAKRKHRDGAVNDDLYASFDPNADDAPPPLTPAEKRKELIELALLCLALIAASLFNNVSWVYLSDNARETYAFFLNLMTTFIVILMQLPILLWQICRGTIPREELTALSWKVLLLIGTIDAVYDTFVSMGSPNTPGALQTILFQLPIPLTMVIAYVIQRKRFRNGQYLGGLIILAGCVLTVMPATIRAMRDESPDPDSADTAQIKPGSVLIYAIGVLFFSCNVIYKEDVLKDTKVNVWFLSVVGSSINFCVTWLLIPLLWIPSMGHDTPSNTFPHIWAGTKCFFLKRSDMDPHAECSDIWWLALTNVFAGVFCNVLTLVIIRKGSALLLQVVTGFQLPVLNLLYAWRWLMSKHVTPMDKYMWIGLGLVTAGFGVYSFLPLGSSHIDPLGELRPRDDGAEEEEHQIKPYGHRRRETDHGGATDLSISA